MGVFAERSDCPVPDISSFSLNLLDTDLPGVPEPIFEMPFNAPIAPPPEILSGCFCYSTSLMMRAAPPESSTAAHFYSEVIPGDNGCCDPVLFLDIMVPNPSGISGVGQGPDGDQGEKGPDGPDGKDYGCNSLWRLAYSKLLTWSCKQNQCRIISTSFFLYADNGNIDLDSPYVPVPGDYIINCTNDEEEKLIFRIIEVEGFFEVSIGVIFKVTVEYHVGGPEIVAQTNINEFYPVANPCHENFNADQITGQLCMPGVNSLDQNCPAAETDAETTKFGLWSPIGTCWVGNTFSEDQITIQYGWPANSVADPIPR